MDQNALKFIEGRQKVLREAYERYRNQFLRHSTSPSNGNASITSHVENSDDTFKGKKWAWRRWDDQELDRAVTACLMEEDEKYRQLRSNSARNKIKRLRKIWLEDFLNDTGSMFRLYRKSEFDVEKALLALKQMLAFRIAHYDQLTWTPITSIPFSKPIDSEYIYTSRTRHRSLSNSSRTSAQSPRSSPDIDSQIPQTGDTGNSNAINLQEAGKDPLIQLYPPSSEDSNNRPLVVVSVKRLDADTQGAESTPPLPPPKTQALAAFERLRRYLARCAEDTDHISISNIPLQFILIIDLAGGRVSSTAWDMARWLVQEAADQFHGMCSAVFVVNYSWEFGALWSFVKHVLPSSARARVMFPTQEDLGSYLGKDALPGSLGGTCTSILPYDIPIAEDYVSSDDEPDRLAVGIKPSAEQGKVLPLHATSSQNPYFGYPAVRADRTRHGLQHSRKRKRDLVKTLMWLLFMRWRDKVLILYWRTKRWIFATPKSSASLLILIGVLFLSLKRDRIRGLIKSI